jgi:hypothetical protein
MLPSYHCDSVIVVIMFHKFNSICNCAFCWNSSTFCWNNFFSVNIKRYTEVDQWADQQKFVEKIRNGSHVYTNLLCVTWSVRQVSELRARSIVLKTQYLLWKSWQSVWTLCKSFYYSQLENFLYESVQYRMHPTRLVLAERQGDVMPWRYKEICVFEYIKIL